jgi:4'-phosphopantetheinyl transferase
LHLDFRKVMADHSWLPPPADLVLSADEVHVWRSRLDLPASQLLHLRQTLAADELGRVARFRYQADRDRFIAARGLLRTILSRYLDLEPGGIRFSYGPFGRPALVAAAGLSDYGALDFNLSHSGYIALFALAEGRRVGVDLERIDGKVEWEPLAERFFSAREKEALQALPPDVRRRAFFACWTRKEAYVKARGQGLSLPLDRFDVSVTPGGGAMLLATRDEPRQAARWVLRDLAPGPGYAAALAVEGSGWRLRCWSVEMAEIGQPPSRRGL